MSSQSDPAAAAVAVLRLLNSPFSGCEYRLRTGATLFAVGAEERFIAGGTIPDLPENAVLISLPEGGVNFEIVIEENSREGFLLRLLHEGADERMSGMSTYPYQEICQAGALKFAVKPIDSPWAEEVLGGNAPVLAGNDAGKTWRSRRWALLAVVMTFVFAGLAATLWHVLSEDRKVAEIASVVAGASGKYQIVKGRDETVYVFADGERDADWGRQALMRQGFSGSVRVSTYCAETRRVNDLLHQTYPDLAFHRLKLTDAQSPVLMLSRERSAATPQTRKAIVNSLMQWLPYAEKISLESWEDRLLARQAQSGLDRIGVAYTRQASADGLTFLVQGSLNDAELSRTEAFAERFYQDFGSRYIHFAIELKDDWLKGKSFKYGSHGYVKMAPKHWYFPQPI